MRTSPRYGCLLVAAGALLGGALLPLSAASQLADPVTEPPLSSSLNAPPPPPKRPQYNNFGGVGLIETRTARMAPDATLAAHVAISPDIQRYSVTFQATPWAEGTFNYKLFDLSDGRGTADRQFDLKIRLFEESRLTPEVAVGFQDFLGTGLFSGEYIVASKAFGPLDLSFGIGWGRLASNGTTDNPLGVVAERFRTRDNVTAGQGGSVNFGQYFQGDQIGIFGGVSYDTPIRGLRLLAEYDSDDKQVINEFDGKFPLNFGASYALFGGLMLNASILQGETFSIGVTIAEDVSRNSAAISAPETRAFPVRKGRGLADAALLGTDAPNPPPAATPMQPDVKLLGDAVAERLKSDGIVLRKITLTPETVEISIESKAIRSVPKAVGRAARVLADLAPVGVENFRIIPVERGLEISEFDLDRTYLEASARERGYSANPLPLLDSFHNKDVEKLDGETADFVDYPRFSYYVGPDLRISLFDPDEPLRYSIDAVARADVEVADGLFLSGGLRADLVGNLDDIDRESDSVLPRVRSDFAIRNRETTVGVERLAAEYFWKPTSTTFAKVSGGLLEDGFGAVGGEVLWRPDRSPFAYGAELYYAKQRDFDTLFTFQDYDVVTGHVSAYASTGFYNTDVAIHAGRYLAGDWGATFELSRRFDNGWEIGAFATFTNVPFDEFGEGSFDKGFTFRVPFDWFTGTNTSLTADAVVRPLTRDGGQRLRPGNRLFRLTQPASYADAKDQWEKFSE